MSENDKDYLIKESTLRRLAEVIRAKTGTNTQIEGRALADAVQAIRDGKSAYEVAVDNGFEGSEQEWLESLKGEKGDDYVLTDVDKQQIATQASKLVTKSSIGLGNVDNTSDANKPVSTAQRTAINTAYNEATAYTDKIVEEKQDKLVSGTNLKTVNGNSLLGGGDISLGGLQLEYLGDAVQGTITTIPTYAKGIAYAVKENKSNGMGGFIYKSGIVYGSPSPYYHTRYHLGFKNTDLKNMGMAIGIAEELDMYIGFLQNDRITCRENTLVSIYSTLDNQVIECPVWIIK